MKKIFTDNLTKNIEGFKVEEGNINNLNDFKKLYEIDLDEKITMREAIDKLKALSHGEHL